MPFPPAERVIYKHNPLRQVICQLQFPTILRIDTEPPADFQERIRDDFPKFRADNAELPERLPDKIMQNIPAEMVEIFAQCGNQVYRFSTRSGAWTISLARDFLALDTNQYTRWEDFRAHLKIALDALLCVYQPQYLTRIGLRYVNVIEREKLGLQARDWRDLIAGFALSHLALDETADKIAEHHGRSLLKLNDDGDFVRMEYGLVTDHDGDESTKLYMLDHDFYTNKEIDLYVPDIIGKLDAYNTYNARLFRWSITRTLHQAMGPQPQ